ncbi:DUF4157 domain-containing protein [Kitasatospora sp. NPDC093550]|uniref:eCIS core domain-containing protein n=1 Tax=Kitasatospora sp. NPDC093550 TaxID=3364089 RepID=UPI0038167D7F
MREEKKAGRGGAVAERQQARRPSPAPSGAAVGLLGLQASVGNAAVVQMLRREGAQRRPAPHRHAGAPTRAGHHAHRDEVPAVQRSAVHEVLRGSGRPLDQASRADMEARLGADFGDVRVHTGPAARASAAEIGARAYTSGNHVVLGEGGHDRHTLAHELTHVIQQRRGPVAGTDNGGGLRVSDPSDRFEREAEANAARVLRGPAPARTHEPEAAGAAPGPAAVQRVTIGEAMPGRVVPADRVQAFQDLARQVWAGADQALVRETWQGFFQSLGSEQAVRDFCEQNRAAFQPPLPAALPADVGQLVDLALNSLPDNAPFPHRDGADALYWYLLDVVLDPAYGFEDTMDLADEIGPDLLRRDILNPVNFASCYPTAQHLFPVLSGVTAQQGESREALSHRAANEAMAQGPGNDRDVTENAGAFRTAVAGLTNAIRSAEGHGAEAVFRIEFAGHGFTLVLRRPDPAQTALHIELIESLAHAASLDSSLKRPGMPVDAVCQALTQMADDDWQVRQQGAGTLGWNSHALFLHDAGQPGTPGYPRSSYPGQANAAEGEYFPRTKMKWWANPLHPNGVENWAQQGRDRLGRLENAGL